MKQPIDEPELPRSKRSAPYALLELLDLGFRLALEAASTGGGTAVPFIHQPV